jgi:hypothetical protein
MLQLCPAQKHTAPQANKLGGPPPVNFPSGVVKNKQQACKRVNAAHR